METPRPGLRACFDALVALPVSEHAAWLDAHDVDAALREQLRRMLAADGHDDVSVPLLRAGAAAAAREFTPESDDGAGLIGSRIGPYRLTEVLGQGGTSLVFRAERPMGEGTQVVALKVLRTGLFSADSQRRFRREQGVLSQLSHPHIAGLIDGGIGDGGIPYIAVEFVDGLSITDYADTQALDVAARLRLLVDVCRAVDSAHRALIVHKDLKPSNVLVSRSGEVKVLDFGIAQLLADGSEQAAQTQAIALTPGYAAPEQHQHGPVTTATDVYALGVLLAELLTGRPLTSTWTVTLSRAIGDDAAAVPAGLPAAPALRRLLRGDLDAIHVTACAAEPARRYGSAALLGDDLERYLHKRPVAARVPSLTYRLRKYVQRNRVGAGAAVLSLLAIVGGVSATWWQARVAQEESRRATAVSNFLLGLFEASRPGQLPEQRLTLEQIVQRAGDRLATQTDLSAPTRIDLLRLLAEVSMAASDFPQAQRLLEQALEAGRKTWAPDDPARRRIRLLQAQLLILQTRYADAADAYEALLPQLRDATDEAAIRGLQDYARALMYSARSEKALAISAEATQAAAGVYGTDSQGAVLAALEHAGIQFGAGQTTEAVAVYEPALQRWREHAWAPSPEFLQGLIRLSRARLDLGDLQAAERLAREDLTAVERLYQPPHEQIARALLNLGEVFVSQERLDEAEPALSRALTMYRTIYGEGQMRDVNTSARIGLLHWRRRDFDAATQVVSQAWRWCTRPGLHATRTCIELDMVQARIALSRGDPAAVETSSTRGLAMAREIYRDGGGAVAELLQLRAGAQLAGGDAAAALRSCDDAWSQLQAAGEAEGPVAVDVLARRAAALEALERIADARTDVEQALRLWARMAPEGYRRQVELLAQLARLQSAAGEASAARATAQSARALIRRREEIDPAALAVLQRY